MFVTGFLALLVRWANNFSTKGDELDDNERYNYSSSNRKMDKILLYDSHLLFKLQIDLCRQNPSQLGGYLKELSGGNLIPMRLTYSIYCWCYILIPGAYKITAIQYAWPPVFAPIWLPYFLYRWNEKATSHCYFLCFLGVSSWQVLISASRFSKQLFDENSSYVFFKGKMIIQKNVYKMKIWNIFENLSHCKVARFRFLGWFLE